MLHFNINLTSLAVILWSGMLIIAGSIWVLSSQVRKLADLIEDQARVPARLEAPGGRIEVAVSTGGRVARRGSAVRVRGGGRAQLAPPGRSLPLTSSRAVAVAVDERNGRSGA